MLLSAFLSFGYWWSCLIFLSRTLVDRFWFFVLLFKHMKCTLMCWRRSWIICVLVLAFLRVTQTIPLEFHMLPNATVLIREKTAHFSFGENGCIEGRLRMMSLDVNGSVDLNSRTHSLFEWTTSSKWQTNKSDNHDPSSAHRHLNVTPHAFISRFQHWAWA